MLSKDCLNCKKVFNKPPTRSVADWNRRAKFCSKACADEHKTGVSMPQCRPKTISRYWLGKKRDSETLRKLWEGRAKLRGEYHPNWKGNQVGYRALHHWVNKNWPKSGICGLCNNDKNKSGRTQWANKENYDRNDRNDWLELCPSCHKLYDLRKLM